MASSFLDDIPRELMEERKKKVSFYAPSAGSGFPRSFNLDAQAERENLAPTASPENSEDKDDDYSAVGGLDEGIKQKHGKVRSALGPGNVIQGKLSFDTPVRIDGKLSGEIFSTKTLIIGKTGQIDARVEVASLIVYGAVRGTIKASERVEGNDGGSSEGEVDTPILMVESGARLQGDCNMSGGSKVVPVGANSRSSKNAGSSDKPTDIVTDESIDLESVIANSKSKELEGVKSDPAVIV